MLTMHSIYHLPKFYESASSHSGKELLGCQFMMHSFHAQTDESDLDQSPFDSLSIHNYMKDVFGKITEKTKRKCE